MQSQARKRFPLSYVTEMMYQRGLRLLDYFGRSKVMTTSQREMLGGLRINTSQILPTCAMALAGNSECSTGIDPFLSFILVSFVVVSDWKKQIEMERRFIIILSISRLDDVLASIAKTDINVSVNLHCMTLADNGQEAGHPQSCVTVCHQPRRTKVTPILGT